MLWSANENCCIRLRNRCQHQIRRESRKDRQRSWSSLAATLTSIRCKRVTSIEKRHRSWKATDPTCPPKISHSRTQASWTWIKRRPISQLQEKSTISWACFLRIRKRVQDYSNPQKKDHRILISSKTPSPSFLPALVL